MKIVINTCYGGFSLSEDVYNELGIPWDGYGFLDNQKMKIASDNDYAYRADKRLIQAIEKIREHNVGDSTTKLKIIDIPDEVKWTIMDYHGIEFIAEKFRVWS